MGKFLKNKVVNNASWIIGAKVVQSILALFINMLSARYLGPSNYGLISYAASITTFVLPIMQLGFSNVLVQELTLNSSEEGKILGSAILLSFVSSLFCIVGVVGFVLVANTNETVTLIVCTLYSLILIFQAFELIQYWFQAKLLSKYFSVVSLIAFLLVSAYKFFLLSTGKTIYWFAISNAFDYMIIAIALLFIYKKLGGQHLSFSKDIAKRMFSKSKFYIVSSLMVTIFAQTDKIMLKLMINEEVVGYYTAAVTIASMGSFIYMAIIDSMRPIIFAKKQDNNEAYEKNIKILYCIIIYLSLIASLLVTIFSDTIVKVLYGSDFIESVSALKIVTWYVTFSYLGVIRGIWILGENKQRYLWIINLIGALLNVILNLILIPYCGIVGAAIASLITQFFTNFVVNYIVWPIHHNNTIMLKSLNPMLILDLIRNRKNK